METLVDKERFAGLARDLALPVPPSQRLDPTRDAPDELELRFPLVVKPLVRDHARWSPFGASAKAVGVTSPASLAALWPRLQTLRVAVLAQELIAGPESNIETYHSYIDDDGAVVAEFAGRKIRTRPRHFGHTTALRITAEPDVIGLGREILGTLGLRGVAKVDFKRGQDGRLHLLEVNPASTFGTIPALLPG